MHEINTQIIINAPVSKVWNILTDFGDYPNWNPFILGIDGDKFAGGKLKVRIQPPDGSGMTFKPKILKFEKNSELRWIGKLLISGLFDGEHYFILTDNGNDTSTFVQGEKFTGILVSLFRSTLHKTKAGFELMNEAIKVKAEAGSD